MSVLLVLSLHLAVAATAPPVDAPSETGPVAGTGGVPQGWPAAPPVTATSSVLVDAATGQVLAAHRADLRRPVASTVKILTALTVLRRADPTSVVEIGREVVGVGGAGAGLRPGQAWTVAQLLDALIARSGNDAAVALAVHVAGSVERFVELMRADAAAMGLVGATITSPSGLDDRNRLSAADLATIARSAMADPAFRAIAARPVVELPSGRVASRNELLGRYPGAIGVKTGFTAAAGYALVAAAVRDERELVAVVLDSATPSARFVDASALLDHGFEAFLPVSVGGTFTLRRPGSSLRVSAGPVAVLVPVADPRLEVPPLPPIEAGPLPSTLVATWGSSPVLEVPVVVDAPPAGGPRAGVGARLLDRLYAGMRAATVAGAWPEPSR